MMQFRQIKCKEKSPSDLGEKISPLEMREKVFCSFHLLFCFLFKTLLCKDISLKL